MAPTLFAPDVLVLAGGGIVGESWMVGLLAGLEDAAGIDLRNTEAFVGTSAGSIVAARLAAGQRLARPHDRNGALWEPGDADGDDGGLGLARIARGAARLGWAVTAPVAGAAVALAAPAAAVARAALLSRTPEGRESLDGLRAGVERWGVQFDGRLRVCAVDRANGRRVVFGSPGAPPASVAQAVCASCAIPWVFEPEEIGGRRYVDGGAWSLTNLDAAPAGRGTHVLCLDPFGGIAGADRRLAALLGALRMSVELEIAGLRRRGAHVRHIVPNAQATAAMGPNRMAPGRRGVALAAGHAQGLAVGRAA